MSQLKTHTALSNILRVKNIFVHCDIATVEVGSRSVVGEILRVLWKTKANRRVHLSPPTVLNPGLLRSRIPLFNDQL